MRLKEIGGSGLVAIEGLPFAAVALVRPETETLLPEAVRRLSRNPDPRGALSVLVPPRPAPEHSDRDDGPVESFAVSGPAAEALLSGGVSPDAPLFSLLSDALGGRIGPIEVVSGDTAPEDVPEGPHAVEAVLPHRGPDRFLEASAASLLRQPGLASLAVGFDQPAPESLGVLAAQENVRLLAFDPAPVGPYVVRQHCALTSRHDVLAMQDSDDVSTAGRLSRQWAHLHETEADILGCHELRIDERHGTVRAHRYPLDANAALAERLGYVCLMGAMMIRTPTLRRLGGFSTVRRIASDTQFVWRAHFSARIRNLDAFLYIRRVWSGSLTRAPDTGIGVPERVLLRQSWSEAFASVRAGRATCRETALGAEKREDAVRVTDVRTGRTQAAVLG